MGNLLIVRARLRDCPDRPRLVEVVRIDAREVSLLGLGSFLVIGRSAADVQRQVVQRFRERTAKAEVPPIAVDVDPAAGTEWEAVLLLRSLWELDCEGFTPEPMRRPDPPRAPLIDRIATR